VRAALRSRVAVAGILALAAAVEAGACPYSIRDAAFLPVAGPSFDLLFLAPESAVETADLDGWVRKAAAAWLEGTNVRARRVDAASAEATELLSRLGREGGESKSGRLAVLVAAGREPLVLGPEEGKAFSSDLVVELVELAVRSPLRARMKQELLRAWCVAVLVEGADGEANARARKAVDAASRRIVGTTTELGRKISVPPALFAVAAKSAEERDLLWSLGLRSAGGSGASRLPRLVVLAGRGQTRGPVLEGDGIAEDRVLEVFTMLGRSCACTTEGFWLHGTPIPLVWSASDDDEAARLLGFDPRDPDVLRSIRGVRSAPEALAGVGGFADAVLGYSEDAVVVEVEVEEKAAPVAEARPVEAAARAAEPGAPTRGLAGKAAVAAVAVLAAAVLASTLMILRRRATSRRAAGGPPDLRG
jgi:hypothetical protein